MAQSSETVKLFLDNREDHTLVQWYKIIINIHINRKRVERMPE